MTGGTQAAPSTPPCPDEASVVEEGAPSHVPKEPSALLDSPCSNSYEQPKELGLEKETICSDQRRPGWEESRGT